MIFSRADVANAAPTRMREEPLCLSCQRSMKSSLVWTPMPHRTHWLLLMPVPEHCVTKPHSRPAVRVLLARVSGSIGRSRANELLC